MKKLKSTFPNMVLSLGVITIAAGALLGWVYDLTKDPIAEQAKEQQVAAIQAVAPQFNNDIEADSVGFDIEGVHYVVYPALLDGQLNGAAVEGYTDNGFAGRVSIMVGYDKDGTIRNYSVLQQGETPGLGTKMDTWFRDPTGARSVIGRNPQTSPMYVTKDPNGTVDAITAATISSRAFLEALRGTFAAYMAYQGDDSHADGVSGATKQKGECKDACCKDACCKDACCKDGCCKDGCCKDGCCKDGCCKDGCCKDGCKDDCCCKNGYKDCKCKDCKCKDCCKENSKDCCKGAEECRKECKK